jgi:hypothetical protein
MMNAVLSGVIIKFDLTAHQSRYHIYSFSKKLVLTETCAGHAWTWHKSLRRRMLLQLVFICDIIRLTLGLLRITLL